MKKTIFVFHFIMLISTLSYAQIHSLSYDLGGYGGFDRGVTITKMVDGLLLTSATICNNAIGCFNITKTDFEGNEQWRVHFNNLPYEIDGTISDPIKKENGNYIIGGGIWHNYDPFDSRAYLMEFDSLNNIIWRQEYGTQTYCYGVKQLEDGGFLLHGVKWVGNITQRHFMKTDSLGNMEWEQLLPLVEDSASDRVRSLELLENGDILQMVGTKSHFEPDGKTLVLMDSSFNLLMSEKLNNDHPLNTVANVARKKKSGGYVTPLYVDTIANLEFGAAAHVVLGLDSLFNIEWVLPFRAYGIKIILNIIVTENGDIIGCGRFNNFTSEEEPDIPHDAAWLFRISPTGELLWDREYYIEEHLAWNGIFDLVDLVELPDGRIAATGRRIDQREDGTPNGNTWLLIVDENGCFYPNCDEQDVWITATREPQDETLGHFKQRFFKISPNPASDFATMAFYNLLKENSQISIYSASGQLLYTKILAKGTKKYDIDVSSFSQGVYFISYEQNKRVLQREKLIVH